MYIVNSEIPKWLEDAVKRCKEGSEHACEIIRIHIDTVRKRYLNFEKAIINGMLLMSVFSSISIIVQLFSRLGMLVIALIIPVVTYVLYVLAGYRRVEKELETLYNIFIDPYMKSSTLIYMTIAAIITCILTVIIVILLT